jgi:anaerobic magnesium-protoporphyrin IX monomethyl ester cyclase
MRLLLINPPIDKYNVYRHFSGGASHLPPLGLAYLAAYLLKYNKNISVKIADASNWLKQIDLIKIIDDWRPDVIGLTSTTIAIINAAELAERIKKSYPEIIIVLGGAHITAAPIETLAKYNSFDIGVIGEGESILQKLILLLESINKDYKNNLSSINSLCYKDLDGKIIITGREPFIKDIDSIPFPAWSLLPDIAKYYRPALQSVNQLPATSIFTSRGCPYSCSFCDNSIFGNSIRFHSVDYVIDMINYLTAQYGIYHFQFDDDTICVDRERLSKICKKIINLPKKISWTCKSRVDNIDENLLQVMKKSGCWQIQFGIESGSQQILDIMNKKVTLSQIKKTLKQTRAAGIKSKGFFMIGYLGETLQTINETLKFIVNIDLDDFQMTFFTPYPGSRDFNRANKYGRFDYNWGKMNEYYPVFIPNGLTAADLDYYQRKAFKKFYLRPRIIFQSLMRFKDIRSFSGLISGIYAFIKAIIFSEKIESK